MQQPLVVVTETCDPRPLAWLKERARVIQCAPDDPALRQHLAEAQGLAVRTYLKVNAELLKYAPRLKVVGRGGVGIDNIDVPACRARGVEVVYTPDANTLAVGDFVFGYLLQLIRPWCFFKNAAYEPAEFKRIRNSVRGRQLDDLTIGVLGMGRIGRRIGRIAANGFGMKVIFNDLLDIDAASLGFAATAVDKPTLYREADILTIHVDMRPGNENLVGREQLALMKQSAIVINTSRGEVLDAAALAQAIRSQKLAGAALDVFAPEPPPADFPLLGLSNVLLTPHLASRTNTALENMSWVVRDILGVIEGRKARYPAP